MQKLEGKSLKSAKTDSTGKKHVTGQMRKESYLDSQQRIYRRIFNLMYDNDSRTHVKELTVKR